MCIHLSKFSQSSLKSCVFYCMKSVTWKKKKLQTDNEFYLIVCILRYWGEMNWYPQFNLKCIQMDGQVATGKV